MIARFMSFYKPGVTQWARPVSEGERDAGERASLAGACWIGPERGAGRTLGRCALGVNWRGGDLGRAVGLGWVLDFGWGWVSSPSISFSSLLFQLTQTNSNSTLTLKQIKQCTSMNATSRLNLEKFNYL